jgi:hypothetical protein
VALRVKMRSILAATVTMAMLALCNASLAQGPPGPTPGIQHRGPGGGPDSFFPPDDAMRFMGFEGLFGGRTVTGAPVTASFSTQSTQSLDDGNKIQHTAAGTFARDSQGRTRNDVTLPAIGRWATAGPNPPHAILINDPVAGAHFILEPDKKIALKMPAPNRPTRGDGPPLPFAGQNKNNTVMTSLGTQTIAGVPAQGTLITRTIPAGTIGNQKPIEITVERWYSAELQMNVMIKRTDPFAGVNVFQLTNIQRQEPDASVFQVPPDYTVKQGDESRQRPGPQGGPPPSN